MGSNQLQCPSTYSCSYQLPLMTILHDPTHFYLNYTSLKHPFQRLAQLCCYCGDIICPQADRQTDRQGETIPATLEWIEKIGSSLQLSKKKNMGKEHKVGDRWSIFYLLTTHTFAWLGRHLSSNKAFIRFSTTQLWRLWLNLAWLSGYHIDKTHLANTHSGFCVSSCYNSTTFYHDDTQRLTKWNHSDKVKPLLLLVMKSILIWINTDHVIETVYTWLNQKPMTKWVFVKVSVQSNSLTVIHTLMVAGCCGLVAARLDSRGADQTAGWAERRWRI